VNFSTTFGEESSANRFKSQILIAKFVQDLRQLRNVRAGKTKSARLNKEELKYNSNPPKLLQIWVKWLPSFIFDRTKTSICDYAN
jgi:hypothetical protein